MTADPVPCRCCGVGLTEEPRRTWRRCVLCDQCDRRHGDELQAHVEVLVRNGQITPWHGIARLAIDDAHICARLELRGDRAAATLWCSDPPEPWYRVICRATARGELPDGGRVLRAVLERHLPAAPTPGRIEAIERDLLAALTFMDPNVLSVEIQRGIDPLDPAHLTFNIRTRTPAFPGMVDVVAPDVEIPPDVMTRPRGQA